MSIARESGRRPSGGAAAADAPAARSPFDLTGHVSVVTGGNGGIGLGIAGGLAAAGAHVCVWGTNPTKNAAAVARIAAAGGLATGHLCDVGDEDQVVATMAEVATSLGRLDSCFVNAGVASRFHPLLETSLAEFREVTRVDLDGAFVTLREAARAMVRFGNGGSLIATASLAVLQGQARAYSYGASKAGLTAMIRAAAVELARHDIRANAILPGWTDSPMTHQGLHDERFTERVLPRMPVRRWGRPEDFAGIAVYLASPASAFHTGDSILVDGGYAAF
ncbi:SDR family NAD(P)-dependent oxidoreductase [Frankia gtarii]|uniref:SDR family NAD(P)-dependent oxidoreductase n=1 Tax=Frankia gtarii TaxID=2950102 RepID=UPI0021BE3A65|nr:SDR family oxidoreductase [Frankia gtarii]